MRERSCLRAASQTGGRHSHQEIPARVLHVIPTLGVGGAERLLVDLASEQQRRGHDVRVLASAHGGRSQQELAPGIAVEIGGYRSAWYDVPLLRRLTAVTRASRADVVHSWSWASNVLAATASRTTGVATLATEHRLSDHVPAARRALTMAAFRTSGVLHVCVSRAVAESATRAFRLDARRVVVATSGIDQQDLLSRMSSAVPLAEPVGGVTIGCLARLEPRKGILELVEVAAALQRELLTPVRCVIAGRSTPALDHATVARFAEERGVTLVHHEHVDPTALFATIDLYVQTSFEEGLPIAPLEAMACGIPVVATAAGGTVDIVPEEGLAAVGDVAGLVAKCREILSDDAARERHIASCTRAAERRTVLAMADDYELTYETAKAIAWRRR